MGYYHQHLMLLLITAIVSSPLCAEQFSIVVLPDTQNYTDSNPAIFNAQTQWIADNQVAENIIYVSHLGDLVDTLTCNAGITEWSRVDNAMSTLDSSGIAYSVLPGNHDWDIGCTPGPRAKYNNGFAPSVSGFGPARFSGTTFYGGSQDAGITNDNNYTLFNSAEVEFIAINLAYSNENNAANTAILNWADGLLKTYPNRKAIISSHFILTGGSGTCSDADDFGVYGAAIWDELKDNPNVFMMLSGHCRGEKWLTISGADDPARQCMDEVQLLMSNYQDYDHTGNNNDSGYLRIMRFDTDAGVVNVETFSPWIADPANPGTLSANGTPTTAAAMNTNSVAAFSFPFSPTITTPGVVVVTDSSGSMSWDVDGTTGVPLAQQRITLAKEAASAFLSLMLATPDSPANTRFGLATFPDHPSTNSAEIMTPLTRVSTSSITNATTVSLPALATENATPMLAGVELAHEMLSDTTCGKSVLLLSDGYHNRPSPASVGDAAVDNLVSQLTSDPDNPTRVFAVSFGRRDGVDYELLQHLAQQTTPADAAGGQFFDATTPAFNPATFDAATHLQATYKSILADVLNLETGADPLAKLKPGETKRFPIVINKQDTKVSVFLSWRTPQKRLIDLAIYDSNGKRLTLSSDGIHIIDGQTYHIVTMDRSLLLAPGRVSAKPWHIEVTLNDHHRAVEPIQYSVLMSSGLKMRAALDRKAYFAGSKIRLTATLTEGRAPIKSLDSNNSRVEVSISTPTESIGNWLAAHPISHQQLARIPAKQGREILSNIVRKQRYLAQKGIKPSTERAEYTLTLFDDGTHGDEHAGDGTYSNWFDKTQQEGVYSFYFRASGPTRLSNRFNREQMIQHYLPIKPSAATTDIRAQLLSASNGISRYAITMTPKDHLHNVMGAGKAQLIALKVPSAKMIGHLKDNLDGSYTQVIALTTPAKTKDQLHLSVRGVHKTLKLAALFTGAAEHTIDQYRLNNTRIEVK